jgi:isoleucyl-tRNA synthetase
VELRPAVRPDGTTNEFVFYDGPPFANGLPHYGHLVTGFVFENRKRFEANFPADFIVEYVAQTRGWLVNALAARSSCVGCRQVRRVDLAP